MIHTDLHRKQWGFTFTVKIKNFTLYRLIILYFDILKLKNVGDHLRKCQDINAGGFYPFPVR